MSVSSHLRIDLAEYDMRIRTFIPHYEEMLDAAADAATLVASRAPTILELGVGTGALARRCLTRRPRAWFIGIDGDRDILAVSRQRLEGLGHGRIDLRHGDFSRIPLPPCEIVVASLALHHVRTQPAKRRLYRRCHEVLAPGGLLVNADAHPSADPRLAATARETWRTHLRETYPARQADAFLRAWAKEDVYFRLDDERAMLAAAGFRTDVAWRRGAFAVVVGRKP
jgi:tRNA (cmo5U34)-methyltransferase